MRLGNKAERDWYLKEAAQQNWSSRALERNIRSSYYHWLLSVQKKKEDIQPAPADALPNPADFIKDPLCSNFWMCRKTWQARKKCWR